MVTLLAGIYVTLSCSDRELAEGFHLLAYDAHAGWNLCNASGLLPTSLFVFLNELTWLLVTLLVLDELDEQAILAFAQYFHIAGGGVH